MLCATGVCEGHQGVTRPAAALRAFKRKSQSRSPRSWFGNTEIHCPQPNRRHQTTGPGPKSAYCSVCQGALIFGSAVYIFQVPASRMREQRNKIALVRSKPVEGDHACFISLGRQRAVGVPASACSRPLGGRDTFLRVHRV